MATKGVGMLCTRMDCPPAFEAEFNHWYDTEHMEERARIPGFQSTRRYVALDGGPRYLAPYETSSLDVFRSDAYRAKIAE